MTEDVLKQLRRAAIALPSVVPMAASATLFARIGQADFEAYHNATAALQNCLTSPDSLLNLDERAAMFDALITLALEAGSKFSREYAPAS